MSNHAITQINKSPVKGLNFESYLVRGVSERAIEVHVFLRRHEPAYQRWDGSEECIVHAAKQAVSKGWKRIFIQADGYEQEYLVCSRFACPDEWTIHGYKNTSHFYGYVPKMKEQQIPLEWMDYSYVPDVDWLNSSVEKGELFVSNNCLNVNMIPPQTPQEFQKYMNDNYHYVTAHLKATGREQAVFSTKHMDSECFYKMYSVKIAELKNSTN